MKKKPLEPCKDCKPNRLNRFQSGLGFAAWEP